MRGALIGSLTVNGQSVSHLGTYERYFEQDGKRWHHILDPRSGYPLDNELDSATIISADSLGRRYLDHAAVRPMSRRLQSAASAEDIDAIFVTKNRDIILSSPQPVPLSLLDTATGLLTASTA